MSKSRGHRVLHRDDHGAAGVALRPRCSDMPGVFSLAALRRVSVARDHRMSRLIPSRLGSRYHAVSRTRREGLVAGSVVASSALRVNRRPPRRLVPLLRPRSTAAITPSKAGSRRTLRNPRLVLDLTMPAIAVPLAQGHRSRSRQAEDGADLGALRPYAEGTNAHGPVCGDCNRVRGLPHPRHRGQNQYPPPQRTARFRGRSPQPGVRGVVPREKFEAPPVRASQRTGALQRREPPIGIEPMTYSLRVNRSSRLS